MSNFPSTLSTISDPQATDNLNSPSHSSIESSQNDAIKKLETFVGTLSSAAGTLMYDVRATASGGGGHIQAANKGGTGQTAFTKGDVLVAQSSSVISKLAIGTNNQVLTADSNQNTGVKWAGVANAVDMQNQTYTYARASVMSGSVYGVKLAQDPSILTDGMGLVIKFPAVPTSSPVALQVHTESSGSVAALIKKTNLSDPDTNEIDASMIGILEFESVSSVFQLVNPREFVDLNNAQSVAGVKVFDSIPQTGGGNPSADTQLARKAYVDTKLSGLGTWATASIGGTTQVADDSFIVGFIVETSGSDVRVKTDSSNPPTTVRVDIDGHTNADVIPFMVPVKGSDYYLIEDSGSGSTSGVTAYIIPLS